MKEQLLKTIKSPFLLGIFFLLFTIEAFSHVTEIRVNQNADGSLTWYLQTYHSANECGHNNAGLNINGVKYPINYERSGSIVGLSSTVFARYNGSLTNTRRSYAVVQTPYIGGSLNVNPYSSNVCWAFLVGGNGSFTPPPPPVCTSFPVTGATNTLGTPSDNGTSCDSSDDTIPVNLTVQHLICGDITGDKKFSAYLDPNGANIFLGNINYAKGIYTPLSFTLQAGMEAKVKFVDNDFAGDSFVYSITGLGGNTFEGVGDKTPPTVAVNNVTVALDANGTASVSLDQINNGTNDACGIASMTLSASTFTCANLGSNTVTLTATDINGNTASAQATVTVVDNTAPTVVAKNVTVTLDANGNASITADQVNNGSSDACSDVNLSIDVSSFSCANVGDNTVTLTGTDASGNSATATAVVTVVDATAPVAKAKSITVALDASGNATVSPDQINDGSSDVCGVTLSLDNTNFTCDSLGSNTVTLTATDPSGNSSTATATVTVVDNTAPTVIAKDITLELKNGIVNFSPQDLDNGSFDNCSFTLSANASAFTCNNIGDNTVILTGVDSSGNTSSATATVTVVGEIPSITVNDFTAVPTQKINTIYLGYGPQSINLSTNTSGGSSFTYEWMSSTGEIVENVANPEISPTTTTTYSVIATNEFGCTAFASFKVCVVDARSFNKKGQPDGKVIVCHHAAKKTFPISISVDAVAAHLSNHGDTLGDCNAACTATNTRSPRGKVIESPEEAGVDVYPNPSKGNFNVKLPKAEGKVSVTLYNMFGKAIQQQTVNAASKISGVDFGSRKLTPGVYVVKIVSQNSIVTKNIVIE